MLKSVIIRIFCIAIYGLAQFIIGEHYGRNGSRLGRVRAHVKLYRNNDSSIHAPTVGDDMRMLNTVLLHLESNGYNMEKVREAFALALIEDNDKEAEAEAD